MNPDVLIVYCTCPDEATAAGIADALVVEKLAACVSRVPGMTSVYLWEDAIQHESETLLLIKTTAARFEPLLLRLCELHPYDLPEIIATSVTAGLPEYLQWVSTCTSTAP